MRKLTEAQRHVLRLIADSGPLRTSKTTHHGYVSGSCAAALVRKGLCDYVWPQSPSTGNIAYEPKVALTDAGRRALTEDAS